LASARTPSATISQINKVTCKQRNTSATFDRAFARSRNRCSSARSSSLLGCLVCPVGSTVLKLRFSSRQWSRSNAAPSAPHVPVKTKRRLGAPNPEEHLRLGWCSFARVDLIVVPTSRLHAVKVALSSSSQALFASKRHRGVSIMSTMFIVPPLGGLLARHRASGGKTGTDVLSSIKLHASLYFAAHEFFLTGMCAKAKQLPF
jgi:hypothetical protein